MPRYTKVGLYPLTSNGIDVTLASGQLKVPDGTAGAPSGAFASETTLGFYRSSAGVFNIVAANGMKVTTDGTTLGTLSAAKFTTTGTGTYPYTLTAGDTIGVASGGNLIVRAGGAVVNDEFAFLTASGGPTYTSGAASFVSIANTFHPASGSGSWAAFHMIPTINGTSSGTAYGLVVASKTNVLTGGTIKLLSVGTTTTDAFTGYAEKFAVDLTGNMIASGHVFPGVDAAIIWPGRSQILSPSDGIVEIRNSVTTDFTRFILGANDASGVAIVKDGAYMQLRLGNGTAVTGAATASLPVAAAARDGIIGFDTTLNALVYYVGGSRFKLVGTAF